MSMEIYADMNIQSSDPTHVHDEPKVDLTQSTEAPLVKGDIIDIIREYNKSGGFTDRLLKDTPTDALAVVNRKYVTANGNTASRPPNPVIGQFYLDTQITKPIWWFGSNWKDATGTNA